MTQPNQPQQPYPGPYGYAAPPPPAPPRRSWVRRHKVLTTLGAIAAVVIIGSAIGSAGGSGGASTAAGGTATTGKAKAAGAKPSTARIGTPVRDGKFEFTVTKARCGVPSIGPAEFGETAQGQFCLVTLKVANIGDKPQTLDSSSQYGYDAAGAKLSADDAAGVYANPAGGGAFLNEINPGNAVTAVLVYDIPKSAKLTRLELHDSPFSGGVGVNLT